MARTAMTEEERQLRRTELLSAAHRLYQGRKVLPTVADIAREAGLAKGTVYLYFRTKEEIFIALLEDDFNQLMDTLPALLAELPAEASAAARHFAGPYIHAIRNLPDLLPLAAISNGVLEQNLPFEAMTRFKLGLAQALEAGGRLLENRCPQLATGAGATLLMRTYALTLGLWQSLEYPTAFLEQLSQEAFRVLKRDFFTELEGAVRHLWEGGLR